MKVLIINGSPRGKSSCTGCILTSLCEGMKQAGAKVQTIHLSEYQIQHCQGCFACWEKTPGKCVIKDDMGKLLEKLIEADLVIYGTPLYYFNMTGLMKDFMDRQLPLALPDAEESKTLKGVTRHLSRYSDGRKKIFLVSPCGFPEISHFHCLVALFKYIAKMIEADYLGEILRPTAEMLKMPACQDQLCSYHDLLKVAGRQLIEKEKIDDDVLKKLHEPWMSAEEFIKTLNEWSAKIKEETYEKNNA